MEYFKDERQIYFAKMSEKAIIPSKKDEDAGYDIYACFEEDFIKIKPHQTVLIPTQLAWACHPDFYMQIEERSSTGSKGIKRSAGIIDSGYRGEIKIAITNSNDRELYFSNLKEDKLKQKYEIEENHPFEYGAYQVLPLKRRHRHGKFIERVVIHEDVMPDSRGFRLFLVRYEDHGVFIPDLRYGCSIVRTHLMNIICVVRPVVYRRYLHSGEPCHDDVRRIGLQHVIRLVYYFRLESPEEEYAP